MKIRSRYGLGVTVVFLAVVAITTTALSIDATLNAYAQNATTTPQPSQNQTAADPQQIKNYLNQAIPALDSGNNIQALDLAEDQLDSMTGTESAEDEDDDEEEEGEIEEGPGEDEDELGDIDTNDEGDTP
jgi:hypothetical protein